MKFYCSSKTLVFMFEIYFIINSDSFHQFGVSRNKLHLLETRNVNARDLTGNVEFSENARKYSLEVTVKVTYFENVDAFGFFMIVTTVILISGNLSCAAGDTVWRQNVPSWRWGFDNSLSGCQIKRNKTPQHWIYFLAFYKLLWCVSSVNPKIIELLTAFVVNSIYNLSNWIDTDPFYATSCSPRFSTCRGISVETMGVLQCQNMSEYLPNYVLTLKWKILPGTHIGPLSVNLCAKPVL